MGTTQTFINMLNIEMHNIEINLHDIK